MRQTTAILALLLITASCGESRKEKAATQNDRKAELEALRKQQAETAKRIEALEAEIAKTEPSAAPEKLKLVGVSALTRQDFAHYIDLQGKLATDQMYYVTPRGMGGQVKAVYVKQGDFVKKGQLLLKLDDAVLRQNIKQLESQLSFAKNIYERQKNLWSEGIGTEVQFLTAKNNVESIEKQIAVVREQASTSNVYAQVSGVAESVNIRVGETFTGSPLAGITIINPGSLKAVVDIPENYVSKVRKGMPVAVDVPDLARKFQSSISLVSETINVNTRSFVAECKMPAGKDLKPNQLAVVRILDHESKNAVVIPVETVQSDDKGKYVFVMREENGRKVARKVSVNIGEFYDQSIEVRTGLTDGDVLITRGFQGLYEGQLIDVVAGK
jgi:membrane fusion protein (multidrug efflux system)